MALIDDLAARLKETTDDLEVEIGSRYPGVGRHAYANEQRRFERDMASVRAARKLLADYAEAKEVEQVAMEEIFGTRLTDDQEKRVSKALSRAFPDYRNGLPIPGEWRDAPPAKPAPSTPQLDALLCELGALGVRLDVLAGK